MALALSLSLSSLLPSTSRCPRVGLLPPTSSSHFPVTLTVSDHTPHSLAIAYPALANSTALYFKSTFNVQIIVADDEPEDRIIHRFRKEVLKAGVLQECKRRRFFENKHDAKKRKARAAARRNRTRKPQSSAPARNKHEAPKKKKDGGGDEEDDNWDIPDVDLPYCSSLDTETE